MTRQRLSLADYERSVELTCERCAWAGPARSAKKRRYASFFSLRCPACDRTLATVSTPESPAETPARLLTAGGLAGKERRARRGSGGSFTHIEFLYDDSTLVACPSCEWEGRPSECSTEAHLRGEFYEVCCPRCDAKIANLPFASHGEIRDLAAAGNAKATAELADLDRVEAFHHRAWTSQLKDPGQLPDLDGDALELIWDFEPGGDGEDNVTVIRHGDRELWREVAYWKGGDRFAEVFTILRRRYGWRLVRLVATDRSLLWLGGDHFTPDCRRAQAGLTILNPDAFLDLSLSSVTDRAGRSFHVLRQGDLVVWRSPDPSPDPPTEEDAEHLQEWVRRRDIPHPWSVVLDEP